MKVAIEKFMRTNNVRIPCITNQLINRIINHKYSNSPEQKDQGIGRKGMEMALVLYEHCFADEFGITHAHSFGTDTQHDYSQVNCRTMSSIIIMLE